MLIWRSWEHEKHTYMESIDAEGMEIKFDVPFCLSRLCYVQVFSKAIHRYM